MPRTSHKATEAHHPRPMVHESDPSRQRWFIVSVVTTCTVAVVGWLYFFSGQISTLTEHIPGAVASDTLKNLTTQTKTFGTTAVDDFKTTLAPAAAAAVIDVQAKLEAQAKLAGVVDEITTQLAEDGTEPPAEEVTEQPVESNQ